MAQKKRILLKISGETFSDRKTGELNPTLINDLIRQMKELGATHQFGIVVGGGNFFRGNYHGKQLGMTPSVSHQVGMLSTMMNGLILKDLLEQQDIKTSIFCAITCPQVGAPIAQQAVTAAIEKGHTVVFTGGTGNPFFTTDTNAVLRGLQIEAAEIWKGTKVDGVYSCDPMLNTTCELIPHLTYKQALNDDLSIIDKTAFAMAEQNNQILRVFNIFTQDCLLEAACNKRFGSIITD